jgi:hypothetical protein
LGYYVRAFCTQPDLPPLAEIQAWLRERGSNAVLYEPDHAVEAAQAGSPPPPILDLSAAEWDQLGITYAPGKSPILAECSQDDGTDDSLVREEVDEFLEFLEDAPRGDAKAQVVRHLKATRLIIACQLATSDIDDRGYAANDQFLEFFVQRCGAMIQADGEGFYQGSTLLLPLA